MQFSCKRCGYLFKLNGQGRLACQCGEMTKEQDHQICRLLIAVFCKVDIDQTQKEVREDA